MSDYFDSGFAVRNPSWHGKELLLPEGERPSTWEQARPLAGLDWDWSTEPLYRAISLDEPDSKTGMTQRFEPVEGFQSITRTDTGAVLHTSAESYEVISIKEMGDIVHTLTDTDANEGGKLKFETMGSVKGGRQVWSLIQLDDDLQLSDSSGKIMDHSPTRPYLGISNRCDGYGACKAFSTSIRIVCANTLMAAEHDADNDGVVATFRHQKNWNSEQKMAQAREAIMGARANWEQWRQHAEHLLGLSFDDIAAEKFVTTFIPEPPSAETTSERVKTNIENARLQLREILWRSKTAEGDVTSSTMMGTAYWAFQGAVEFLDHKRNYQSTDSYVRRQLLKPERSKLGALRMINEIANESSRSSAVASAPKPRSNAKRPAAKKQTASASA